MTMDRVTLQVGIVASPGAPGRDDLTREIEFIGEELGAWTKQRVHPQTGKRLDNQGSDQTLYVLADGRLLVYEVDWHAGLPDITRAIVVQAADLRPGGRYSELGEASGYDLTPSPGKRGGQEQGGEPEF